MNEKKNTETSRALCQLKIQNHPRHSRLSFVSLIHATTNVKQTGRRLDKKSKIFSINELSISTILDLNSLCFAVVSVSVIVSIDSVRVYRSLWVEVRENILFNWWTFSCKQHWRWFENKNKECHKAGIDFIFCRLLFDKHVKQPINPCELTSYRTTCDRVDLNFKVTLDACV